MTQSRPEPKVIVIPAKEESPQDQEKKKNLRVAAYCRVSTKKDEQLNSYENQKAYYTEKIMANPDWTMADIFADEGITGTSACKRKDFLRMIRQCRQGKIDMILAKSVSRFARNTVDTLNYTRELRGMGIPVIFEEQNINSIYPESEFLIALHAAFAQSESESISANVRWGKRQSIKDGKVTFQYKTLLGYEKGSDGNPVIIPEEAETVRRIFEWYLAGKSVRDIRLALVAGGFRNAVGTTDWTTSNLRSILSNEKYCGDALLQKTFVKDCISKKSIPNTGQLAKVLIQNNHEAIISHEIFDAVQLELARRRAQDGRSRKSAPTGRGKFSGKYALSGLLFCAECGTAYRRVVWTQHGEKRAVWRCTSRLDYGRKYCLNSPTLDEEPLQQAILNAINSVMSDHSTLAEQLRDTMEQELSPIPGESMSLGDIDRAIADLGRQFTALLSEAADADNADGYTARFQSISTAMAEFKRRKAIIQQLRQEQDQANHRMQRVTMALKSTSNKLTDWDDSTIYQMLEKVTVLSRERIRVTLRDGLEIEQAVEQPKRRKFA
jgi:DNA invertase Pin-like site-specific DNA recombinase